MSVNGRVDKEIMFQSILVVTQIDAQIAPFLASGSFLISVPGSFCMTHVVFYK